MTRKFLIFPLFLAACAFAIVNVVLSRPRISPKIAVVKNQESEPASAPAQELTQTDAGESTQESEVQPININSASQEALEQLPGIGAVLAERIVAYREAHGGFYEVAELTEVQGVGEKMLQNLLPYIYCE